MGYWDNLFETDAAQGSRIDQLQRESEEAADDVAMLHQRLLEQRGRIDRLELTVEALLEVLRERKAMTRDEVAVMIQQIDLADGIEDGRIGPDRTASAPKCHICARPVNPRRKHCLYCREPVKLGHEVAPRMARCVRCGTEVAEISTYFSDLGLVCGECHRR